MEIDFRIKIGCFFLHVPQRVCGSDLVMLCVLFIFLVLPFETARCAWRLRTKDSVEIECFIRRSILSCVFYLPMTIIAVNVASE